MSIQTQIQDISHAFRTDAEHQLIKAKTAFEHGSVKMRTGFQAKIVVDPTIPQNRPYKKSLSQGTT